MAVCLLNILKALYLILKRKERGREREGGEREEGKREGGSREGGGGGINRLPNFQFIFYPLGKVFYHSQGQTPAASVIFLAIVGI